MVSAPAAVSLRFLLKTHLPAGHETWKRFHNQLLSCQMPHSSLSACALGAPRSPWQIAEGEHYSHCDHSPRLVTYGAAGAEGHGAPPNWQIFISSVQQQLVHFFSYWVCFFVQVFIYILTFLKHKIFLMFTLLHFAITGIYLGLGKLSISEEFWPHFKNLLHCIVGS